MRRAYLCVSTIVCAVCSIVSAADYDQEFWDDALRANNHWSYYDTDANPPHVPMVWLASGGVGDSGYVKAPLKVLDSAHNDQAFWPAYLFRTIGDNQEIDLSIPDAVIKVYASEVTSSAVRLDLKGGSLHFFIGQWVAGPGGPQTDKWSFFYNLTPVTISDHGWTMESALPVGGDAQWGEIANNDPSVHPSDLFHHPEQWGFVIFGAADTPAGELAFDSFRIVSRVPSPSIPTVSEWGLVLATLMMIVTGAVVTAHRPRRRRRFT